MWGRILDDVAALVRAVLPRVDYYAPYFGKVVGFNFDAQTVDVTVTDSRLPVKGLGPLKLRHGLPGVRVKVSPGTSVIVAFANGDPTQPQAYLWGGSEAVQLVEISADKIQLAGEHPVALGDAVATMAAALKLHTHAGVTTGGGVSGPSAELQNLPDPKSTKVFVG